MLLSVENKMSYFYSVIIYFLIDVISFLLQESVKLWNNVDIILYLWYTIINLW